jgi:nucleotide-binding universal stress UspA family protein
MERLPPRALLDHLPTPLLLLPGSRDEPLRLREVVVACDDVPATVAAALSLSGLCRGAASDVVLLQEGDATPQLEGARRRLEASGASTLLRRWSGKPRPEALQAEVADADLVVLGSARAKEPLLSTLLSERPVLVLPAVGSTRSQACA